MAQSLYSQFFDATTYPQIVLAIVEKLNEQNTKTLPYLHKQILEPQFCPDGRYSSILAENTRVVADVVSLNSELPLKSRDSIEVKTGYIPKIGIKLALNEKQMKDLDNMVATYQRNRMVYESRRAGMTEQERTTNEARLGRELGRIMREIFQDTRRSIEGIDERMEGIFLEMLSSGIGLAQYNVGTGLRLDMGFRPENQFCCSALFNAENSTPIDDIQKLVDKATDDQNTLRRVYMDDTALNLLYRNAQVRQQYAFDQKVTVNGDNVPALDLTKLQELFRTKWDIEVVRINRTCKAEVNGDKKKYVPWKKGAMTFVCDDIVGSVAWTDIPEMTRPVAGTMYQTVNDYILASKYSKEDPLREFTAAQGMAVPVINNVDRIYCFDTQTVAA